MTRGFSTAMRLLGSAQRSAMLGKASHEQAMVERGVSLLGIRLDNTGLQGTMAPSVSSEGLRDNSRISRASGIQELYEYHNRGVQKSLQYFHCSV